MIKEKSLKKNYFYNLIYQIFLIIVPILVTPYVARVIGENGIGQYSYTSSIQSYFSLFAALGCNYYAQRVIASHQNNKTQQIVDLYEIIIARLIPIMISLVVYYILIFLNVYQNKYELLMMILSINIIAIMFDVTFFFQGNEEFGKIVIRNVIIKIISIMSIFIFVKKYDDLWKYTLIQCLTLLISNLSLWLYFPNMITRVSLKKINPLKHLRPMLILFLPTIATSIYTSLDKTLIGILTKSDAENGNYEYAEKLVKMTMTIVTSLGAVMIPRNSKNFAEGKIDKVKENIYNTSKFVLFIGIPLMFGLMAIADNLVPWYLGSNGYAKVSHLMKILSPIIVIIGLSNVFGVQYLIPSKQDKKFTVAIVIGACVNFILNLCMIPIMKSEGAALATVIAELTITIIMAYSIRKEIDVKIIVKSAMNYLFAGIVMFLICSIISDLLNPDICSTFFCIIIGGIIYSIILILIKDKIILTLISNIKKRIFTKKG